MFDIIKNIFKKATIGTIIFFCLNAAIIGMFLFAAGVRSLQTVLIIYAVSIVLAFSPFGEWMLCLMAGAKKMTRVDMKIRMIPLLEVVYNKAKRKTPGLTNEIVLKVIYQPEPNAYAIGRRTICVTEGLFRLPDNVIRGILAHEVAHLALRHTEIQLLIGGGNIIVSAFIMLSKLIAATVALISLVFGWRHRSIISTLPGIFLAVSIWLWTRFCLMFLMWSSRQNEYDSDKYANELGYGYELAKGLDAIGGSEPQKSFLKALYSTHPHIHDRVGRLQQLGVRYYRY